jgi:glycosyltransferase involved in cell wall biosynthesis
MPPLLVHASVEHAESRWGGIGSALDLLVAASVRGGQPVAVLSIGKTDRTVPLAGGRCLLHLVAVPELGDDILYRSPDRVQLAEVASRRMAEALDRIRAGGSVDLCVHNDELTELAEIAAAKSWVRSVSAFVHGLARQEHPARPELHRQQDRLLSSVDRAGVFSHSYETVVKGYYPALRHVGLVNLPLELLIGETADVTGRQAGEVSPGVLLAAGRAVPQKGFDLLLEALTGAPVPGVRQVELVMGHGDAGYELACAAAAKSAGPFVSVSGWTSRGDLLKRMARAAALVVPSRFEPLGLVAAEALALGVPVVASAVGGLTELVKEPDLGWQVPAGEGAGPAPADLAAALAVAAAAPPRVTGGPRYLRQWGVSGTLRDLTALIEG